MTENALVGSIWQWLAGLLADDSESATPVSLMAHKRYAAQPDLSCGLVSRNLPHHLVCTVATSKDMPRTSADKTIEIELDINAECLAGHSYIDMTRFFPRSNGKVHVTSSMWRRSLESLGAAPGEQSGHTKDEAMIFAPATGAEFPIHRGSTPREGENGWHRCSENYR